MEVVVGDEPLPGMPPEPHPRGLPRREDPDFVEYCVLFKDLTTAAGHSLSLSSTVHVLNALWLKGYRPAGARRP